MEQIQAHEIKDVYRIKDGVLVEVVKYQTLGSWLHGKRPEKRVKGCKGLTILKEEFKGVKEGTYLYEGRPVEVLTDPTQFRFEIKSSGGTIQGDSEQLQKLLKTIQELIKTY